MQLFKKTENYSFNFKLPSIFICYSFQTSVTELLLSLPFECFCVFVLKDFTSLCMGVCVFVYVCDNIFI